MVRKINDHYTGDDKSKLFKEIDFGIPLIHFIGQQTGGAVNRQQ